MGESLWVDLDAWQVAQLQAQMGAASAYPTLKAEMVVATIVRNYQEWDNPSVWKFPAVIAMGGSILRPALGVQSGANVPRFRKTYPYSWVGVVEGDSFSAERDAKILEKRLELVAREMVANSWGQSSPNPIQPDESGERVMQILIGNSAIVRVPRSSDADSDPWFGVCSLFVDFITTL